MDLGIVIYIWSLYGSIISALQFGLLLLIIMCSAHILMSTTNTTYGKEVNVVKEIFKKYLKSLIFLMLLITILPSKTDLALIVLAQPTADKIKELTKQDNSAKLQSLAMKYLEVQIQKD